MPLVAPCQSPAEPEVRVAVDGIVSSHSTQGASLSLRMVELSVSAALGSWGAGFANIEIPELETVEIPETYVVFPAWGLRAGRMLMELGGWNQVHQHDLPMPSDDPVRSHFFGGRMNGTGLEWSGHFGEGKSHWDLTVGAWSDFETHGHMNEAHSEGEDHEHGGSFQSGASTGDSLSDFAFNARISHHQSVGSSGNMEWGLSAFSTRSGLQRSYEDLAGTDRVVDGLASMVVSLDGSYSNGDVHTPGWSSAGVELWKHHSDLADFDGGVLQIERPSLFGGWGFYEHGIFQDWSLGVLRGP